MYHIYQFYLSTMPARLFHSSDLEGLREGLTWSDDDAPVDRPGASTTRHHDHADAAQAPGASCSAPGVGGPDARVVRLDSATAPGTQDA